MGRAENERSPNPYMPKQIDNKPAHDSRLEQLMELAREGNEEARADLWREFSINFPVVKEGR